MVSVLKLISLNLKVKIFIIVTIIFLIALFVINVLFIAKETTRINSTKPMFKNDQADVNNNKTFRILLWNEMYRKKWIDLIESHQKCQYTNCVYSDDHSSVDSFDAIVFHWYNIPYKRPKQLPKKVLDYQKWVLFTMESPIHTRTELDKTGLKKIDWIMSYRTDSDIYYPYGRVVKCNNHWKQKYSFENKTKSIAWVVSHCKTPSNREEYAKKLRHFIKVDVFGKCGPNDCPNDKNSCFELIANKYKFYLSFENSICKEYVTEKAFDYMKYDIIPVVLGGANYSAIFPLNSYIDALNFSSPRLLAQYLQRVGTDKKLYNSYFEWKTKYCIESVDYRRNLCQLCERLNTNLTSNKNQSMKSRKEWWANQANCQMIEFTNATMKQVKIRPDPILVSNWHKPKLIEEKETKNQGGMKGKFKILLWTKWSFHKNMNDLLKQQNCGFTNCEFTYNRTKLHSFDVIAFKWKRINPNDLPKHMAVHQKWVLFQMESPEYTDFDFKSIGLKKIDWFMSYRRDSDIFSPYGKFVKCKSNWKQEYSFENKSKLIAWVVSHCKTASKREEYVKELQKYIDVDIYGKCGPLKCPKHNESCFQMIANQYKFYLSFENSICKDYVTEKAFHYMQYDIIPVVLGGANYSSTFPPNSYIDALNFSSPRLLAQYLQRVETDKSLYNSYFEWKTNYCIERVTNNLCEVCKRLNTDRNSDKNQKMKKRNKWWFTDAHCQTINLINNTIHLVQTHLTRI